MKKKIRNIGYLLLVLAMLPILSGCNNEDDVIAIFTGKTWKLSYISTENSNKQYDFWNGNNTALENSMKALENSNNFILNFEGTDLNGITGGSLAGRGILCTISGNWSANGENNELIMNNIKASQAESDPLAQAFVTGLKNAYKYGGDQLNLYIYYKEGQTVKRLCFKPLK